MLTSQIAAGASVAVGGGGGGQPAEMGYHHDFSGCAGGKDMDWSVFSASSFNISPGDSGGQIHQQSQWEQTAMADHNSNPLSSQPSQTSSPSKHQQLQQAMSTQQESQLGNNMSSGSPSAGGGLHSAFAADNASGASMFGVGGSRGEGSGSGSISSGGTPPQRSISSTTVPSTIGGMMGGVSVGSKAVGSPSTSGTVAGTVAGAMARLSITPDDSTAAVGLTICEKSVEKNGLRWLVVLETSFCGPTPSLAKGAFSRCHQFRRFCLIRQIVVIESYILPNTAK